MADPILVVKDLAKAFNRVQILKGISFSVNQGEHVSLVGPSSSGKSTLFKLLLGVMPLDEGTIFLMGEDIGHLAESKRRSILKQIEMQFQQGALFDSMTVRDNILLPLNEETSLEPEEKEAVVCQLLKSVDLIDAINKYPYELSGGMRKRVSLVRALAIKPKIALFDEPASGLDPITSVNIVNMIKKLSEEEEMTLLVATTSIHMAQNFANRFLVLHEGRIVADGYWQELLDHPDPWVSNFIRKGI